MKLKEMDIVTKMAILGALGLIAIVIIFTVVYLNVRGKDDQREIEEEKVGEQEQQPKEYVRTKAVIQEVETTNNELVVYAIDIDEEITLKIDGAVDIKNEYNTPLTLAQLEMGNIVDTKYDQNTMRPESIMIAGDVWERKDVEDMSIDPENQTIQLANDVYNYTKNLVVTYLGEPFNILDLNPIDKVSVKGYKDTIWSIKLLSGHGNIVFQNHEKYLGGILEIGKKTYSVTSTMNIPVPIGVHSIILSKDGMSPYITQVLVVENEEAIVDVEEAKAKIGLVDFAISQKDVKLFIDNEEVTDFLEPVQLKFGEYQLRVEKENFVPWESKLIVNQEFMDVEIDMEKEPMYIHIDSPVGASLYIDANYIGEIPVEAPIGVGTYTIMLRKDGYYPDTHRVIIEDHNKDSYFTFPALKKIGEQEEQESGEQDMGDNDQENQEEDEDKDAGADPYLNE